MQVRLLGPLEVDGDDGAELRVPGAKLRALLALLALDAGRIVPIDRLIDDLWSGDPPAGVANALQRLVSKLRRVLGSADLVVLRPPGYVLDIAPGDVDLHRLPVLAAESRSAAADGDLEGALARYAEAEALWRGPALADFTYDDFARPHAERLHELRRSLVEERLDVQLASGVDAPLVAELEALVADDPLRERVRAQLMVALYRAGRQAEALRTYEEGRRALADEVGLEPGPELQRLEAAVLAHDTGLLGPGRAPAGSAPPRSGPAAPTCGLPSRRSSGATWTFGTSPTSWPAPAW